jgi:glycine/D-amino acid oxidase-like deaminating enzyme/nitrite reductase/ring-hydroxylating ferredoxin subunit
MTSLWRAGRPAIPTDPFPADARFDHIVVGAGLTGLVTALLLARRGRAVVVLEGRTVGAAASGNTTGKLSLLQGVKLQKVRALNTPAVFQAYVDSQRAAFEWMRDYLTEAGVPFQRLPAVTYAESPDEVDAVRREYAAARAAGLPALLTEGADLPDPGHAAVVLDGQVQFDPMDVLARLARDIRALGGVIVEGARVVHVGLGDPAVAHTEQGSVSADSIVFATGTPPLVRGLYWAKVEARRSYLVSFRMPEADAAAPTGMFLGAGDHAHSIRWHEGSLLVGGSGHDVGRQPPGFDPYGELEEWTRERWPDAEPTHRWSAQDYTPSSRIPFVGYLPRGRGRAHLATGYDKWGMTGAVAAALLLEADLAGRREGWQRVLGRRPTLPQAVGVGIGANAAVLTWYARGYAGAIRDALRGERADATPAMPPRAIIASEHGTTEVCLMCPHLGAIVRWNEAESTWDCPAHGSRFRATGEYLEGPTMGDLSSRPRPDLDDATSASSP